MPRDQFRSRITSSTTTHVVPTSCAIMEITISVANSGTSWTIKVQDQNSPAFVLVPATTVALPSTPQPIIMKWDNPVRMVGGVDVVTAGTAGELEIWITLDSGTPIPT